MAGLDMARVVVAGGPGGQRRQSPPGGDGDGSAVPECVVR